MSTIVPFDSGTSYIVRELLVSVVEGPKATDKLGRSALDLKYMNDYEIIFLNAAKGDLKKCEEVINRGFRDFDAKSYGRYGIEDGETFHGISPRQVAEIKNHPEILALFDRYSSKVSTQLPEKNSGPLKQNDVAHFTAEEKQAYDDFMDFIKTLSKEEDYDAEMAIHSALISSYAFEELIEKMSVIDDLDTPSELLAFVRKRIDQPFSVEKLLERPRLMALRDFFDTSISKV